MAFSGADRSECRAAGPVRRLGRDRGQASVELVGAGLLLVVAALAAFQILAAGQAASVADGAAEAAAIALVNGRDPESAARAAAPGWARDEVQVRTRGERVIVTLAAPAALRALRGRLRVSADATVRRPGGQR